MTPPISECLKAEYFSMRAALADRTQWDRLDVETSSDPTAWYNHISNSARVRRWLLNESELNARVLRLVFAGLLAQCDRPRASRATMVLPNLLIFAHDSHTPPAVRRLSPQKLGEWLSASDVRHIFPPLRYGFTEIEGERNRFDLLLLELARHCYRHDHGRQPATYQALLGPYVSALPEGFEPTDLTTAPADAEPTGATRTKANREFR
jgi:hypothetical protein